MRTVRCSGRRGRLVSAVNLQIVASNTISIVDVRLELFADSRCEEISVLHQMDHDNSGYYDNCNELCARSSNISEDQQLISFLFAFFPELPSHGTLFKWFLSVLLFYYLYCWVDLLLYVEAFANNVIVLDFWY